MNDWPYHQYLFFELDHKFHQLSANVRASCLKSLGEWSKHLEDVQIVPYTTLGFKPHSTFMFWMRAHQPEHTQTALRNLMRTEMGQWLTLQYSLFGIIRRSQYSNRPQKSDQVIRADERLPYLIIYPFTKTIQWHQMEFERRASMMKSHIMVGVTHPKIRQCLLYAYGVDDHEFVVSYETPTLEEFQDLIMQLRPTEARLYTENDLPIYTCIYKPLEELIKWL